MNTSTLDNAGAIAPPPLIVALAVVAGLLLEWLWPTPPAVPGGMVPGSLLLVAGGLLAVWCFHCFRRAGTSANPYTGTHALSCDGPYRFSRNPMYLSLGLMQAGIGVWLKSLWVLAMIPPAMLIIRHGVIAREERYLERRFGESYRNYRRAVRRWL